MAPITGNDITGIDITGIDITGNDPALTGNYPIPKYTWYESGR